MYNTHPLIPCASSALVPNGVSCLPCLKHLLSCVFTLKQNIPFPFFVICTLFCILSSSSHCLFFLVDTTKPCKDAKLACLTMSLLSLHTFSTVWLIITLPFGCFTFPQNFNFLFLFREGSYLSYFLFVHFILRLIYSSSRYLLLTQEKSSWEKVHEHCSVSEFQLLGGLLFTCLVF